MKLFHVYLYLSSLFVECWLTFFSVQLIVVLENMCAAIDHEAIQNQSSVLFLEALFFLRSSTNFSCPLIVSFTADVRTNSSLPRLSLTRVSEIAILKIHLKIVNNTGLISMFESVYSYVIRWTDLSMNSKVCGSLGYCTSNMKQSSIRAVRAPTKSSASINATPSTHRKKFSASKIFSSVQANFWLVNIRCLS